MRRQFALLLLALLLSGCSALNAINPFSSSKPRIPPLAPITPTAKLTVNWQASVGPSGDYVFTPAVVGSSVYAAAHDGTLARFDQGREVWRIDVGHKLSGGVGSDGKRVVVGTPEGKVLAFDAHNGHPLWQAQVSSQVLAAPAVGYDLVVVRSEDARLFAFDAATGKRLWIYQHHIPSLSVRSNVGVVLASNAVLAGFPGGKLVAVSTANGAPRWQVTVAQPKGATELERVADITSPPVFEGREACAVAYQGRIACYDTVTGNLLWARKMSSSAGLDMDQQTVYVSDERGIVHALDRHNGASVWTQRKLIRRGLSRPLALGRFVVVADSLGFVHLLRSDTGAFAARIATDGSAIAADPQPMGIMGSDFVVQTKNGDVYSLSAQ